MIVQKNMKKGVASKKIENIREQRSHNNRSIKSDNNNITNGSLNINLKSLSHQRRRMDELYYNFELENLDSWLHITREQFRENGGKTLLYKHYKKDFQLLFTSIYPNYPWDFSNMAINSKKRKFKSMDQNRLFMDQLFVELNLNCFDEWLELKRTTFFEHGGEYLWKSNNNNFIELLLSIYPNYPWESSSKERNDRMNIQMIENQREIMDKLFYQLKLTAFWEWRFIPKYKLAKAILSYYNNDLNALFTSLYPNYPWRIDKQISSPIQADHSPIIQLESDSEDKEDKSDALPPIDSPPRDSPPIDSPPIDSPTRDSSIDSSPIDPPRDYTETISKGNDRKGRSEDHHSKLLKFYNLSHFTSLENWKNVTRNDFLRIGGKNLLINYQNNLPLLLSSLYPNYPWQFPRKIKPKASKDELQLLKHRKLMDRIFVKLKLSNLDKWLRMSQPRLREKVGEKVFAHYQNDFHLLLKSIYPHYPWEFSLCFHRNIKEISNQKEIMEVLFYRLGLLTLRDFKSIPTSTLISRGGEALLKLYKFDRKRLLSSIFPHYPWAFVTSKISRGISNIDRQRELMDSLFIKFRFVSIDDWLNKISPKKFNSKGGSTLMEYYHNNYDNLLLSIYPNFPWKFKPKDEKTQIDRQYFKSLQNQQLFMDNLFKVFKLTYFRDWRYISLNSIALQGGNILLRIYKADKKALFSSIYPNYPWVFSSTRGIQKITPKISSRKLLRNIEVQRQLMEDLFQQFKMKTLNDWYFISNRKMRKYARDLFRLYHYQFPDLLSSIYPNYPWGSMEKIDYKLIDNQVLIMEQLYHEFNLQSLGDWFFISPRKIATNGGASIVRLYKHQRLNLLTSIYPNYPWKFEERYCFIKKLTDCISKYMITQKKHWYRLPTFIDNFELYSCLQIVYPTEHWRKPTFILRRKKSTQRLLFSFTQQIFPSLLVLEDYFHPKLATSDNHYELDLFIPALQLALEYQGNQHYDDLPSTFAGVESCQLRDYNKIRRASDHSIRIIHIPYWWDRSFSSLLSSLQSPH